jgi:hypothetical protein
LKAIAIALALLDFAPVFFLSLGLFFLAQLVDRLEPRCRVMARAGFGLVMLGGLARAFSNLTLAITGQEIPLLAASLYVFAGPGFTLMAAAMVRAHATANQRVVSRDPWIAPSLISWLFLGGAYYLNASVGAGDEGNRLLIALALCGNAVTCLVGGALGWSRHLHMAAGLFGMNMAGNAIFAALRLFAPQNLLLQLFGELVSLAAQAAFAFASWRVAAEYEARVGPIATK